MSEMTATSQAGDAARALSCLDLTSLNLDDTPESIDALCDRALSPAPGIELHPAAVCIYPKFAAQVRARLAGTDIAVAAVANFPLGTSPLDDVLAEVEQALADGADEIDVVFPFRAYLAGDHLAAGELVQRVAAVCHRDDTPATLKVILETGVLHDTEVIKAAAAVAVANGADFLKTSTGKFEPAATPASAEALLEVIDAARRAGRHGRHQGGRRRQDGGRGGDLPRARRPTPAARHRPARQLPLRRQRAAQRHRAGARQHGRRAAVVGVLSERGELPAARGHPLQARRMHG